MILKIETYLIKKRNNRVAKGAVYFEKNDGILAGFHLVGFTICDDPEKGLYVMFPASTIMDKEGAKRPYYMLKPDSPELIEKLEKVILDRYESMIDSKVIAEKSIV